MERDGLAHPLIARVGLALIVATLATFAASRAPALAATTAPDCRAPARTPHVFFITDREPAGDAQLFSGERGLTPQRRAIVSRGILGPHATRSDLRACASQTALLAALAADFDSKRGRQVIIYIHGYYTPFKRAADDALVLQRGLRFPGPVLLYSWPSKATSRLTYINDEANAGWSEIHFRDTLSALIGRYPGIGISFAAHSLGARFAVDGIDYLRHGRCAKCVGRALFFAPDIDGDTLHAALAGAGTCAGRPPTSPAHAAPVTLYVSNRDLALRQSQRIHGHQRGGQAGSEMIVCRGVDTIDVSAFKGGDPAGHSYHVDDRIAGDARDALAGVSPTSPKRRLRAVGRAAGVYYELR